jgi:PAS domain S-box-containing protein
MDSAHGTDEVTAQERLGTPLAERDVLSYRRLLEASDTLLCELDLEGRFLAANGPMTQVLGANVAELRQRGYLEFVHPEDRGATESHARAMNARPGEVFAFRNRYIRHDGQVIWLAWQALCDRESGRVYALAQDVTAQVQAEQAVVREHAAVAEAIADSESRLAEMSDHTPALVYIKDQEGRYLFVNRYYEGVMGRRRGELLGRSDREVLPAAVADLFASSEEQVRLRGVPVECEEVLPGGADGPRTFFSVKFPLRRGDGTIVATCGISTDITRRRQAEAALLELNESLERRIAERTAAAEEASRAKSEFLARMSHELRTPLNAILGYSELIEEELRDRKQDESVTNDVRRIRTAGKHLLQLINDILDISKIEAGKMLVHVEEFSVSALVEEVLAAVRPGIERGRNELRVELEPAVGTMRSDALKLRQCLLNMLSNAGKFTQDGTVTLRVKRQTVNGRAWVLFTVIDTGIGIAPEHVGQLFREFYQVDTSSTRRYEGSGLGLVITRRLCHMLGGEIRVVSTPGSGSTFTAELPAVHIDAGAPEVALELEVLGERDVARARMAVRELCQKLGARPLALQKIATVVSELARNMVLYASGGRLVVGSVGTDKKCVFIRAIDEGSGIPELDAILAGRKVTRNGRGLGLVGAKRLADGFRIHTGPTGTWIEVEVNL